MAQVTFNTRLSPELDARLTQYSKDTGTSKAQIVAKALEQYFEGGVKMLFTVRGRNFGQEITVESDYDAFLSQFYGCDEEPVVMEDGVYIVDDETIVSTLKEYPEVIR